MPRLRAAVATALLLAFPLFALGLVALLVWLVTRWQETDGAAALPWQIAGMLVASLVFAIGFAVRDVLKLKVEPAEGPELTRADHPRLWAEIDALAAHVGVHAPTRAVLVPETSAAVAAVGDTHELTLGLPLLATFTVPELRSVLAHELGHIAGGDTTASARLARWQVLVITAYERASFPASIALGLYGRLAHAVTAAADRDVERVADRFSAEVAGPAVAAAALRHVVAVDGAWDLVAEELLPLCAPAGVRAPAVDALDAVLREASGKLDDAVREVLADRHVDWTSSHPPIGARVEAFEAMVADGAVPPGPGEPAHALLGSGRQWLIDAEADMITADLPLADWDEVVRRGMETVVIRAARELARGLARGGQAPGQTPGTAAGQPGETPTYADVLDLAAREPEEFEDAEEELAMLGTAALVEAGRLRFAVDWSDGFRTIEPDGAELDLQELVQTVDSHTVATLRALLEDRGASLTREPGAGRDLTDRSLQGVITHVRGPGRGRLHGLVYGNGVLLLPADTARLEWWFGQKQLGERERVARLAREPVGELRTLPGARWLEPDDVARFRFAGAIRSPHLTLRDGTDLRLRLTSDSEGIEEGYPALGRLFVDVLE